ncbi:unnamed protein product [Cochlearia groenlandica]
MINDDDYTTTTDDGFPRSKRNPWWMSKYVVIYDIVMHIIVLEMNVATYMYVTQERIPIAGDKTHIDNLWFFYWFTGLMGVYLWIHLSITAPDHIFTGGVMHRTSHILGLAYLTIMFYSISPFFALSFAVSSSFWFLPVFLHICYVTF